MAKKSLRGETLDSKSTLKGRFANEIPAIKAPIAIDKSKTRDNKIKKKRTAKEDNKISSFEFVDFELDLNIFFNTIGSRISAKNASNRTLKTEREIRPRERLPEVNIAIAKIANKSCKSKIPKTSLPCIVTISFLSDRILTTTIVELNAKIIPM